MTKHDPKTIQKTPKIPPRKQHVYLTSIKLKDLSLGTHLTRKSVTKICRKLKSRASETFLASSYGQITILKPDIWIFGWASVEGIK